ncbi:hypothetical protein L0128_22850, partial [candidate division KSB1 bacterium]|nr:hypothetical protein [candidate division KSB1 bacterium]
MKRYRRLFFVILLFIFSCSTQKKSVKYASMVIDRKLVNSLYEDTPVFSSYENVSLLIDSLAF